MPLQVPIPPCLQRELWEWVPPEAGAAGEDPVRSLLGCRQQEWVKGTFLSGPGCPQVGLPALLASDAEGLLHWKQMKTLLKKCSE